MNTETDELRQRLINAMHKTATIIMNTAREMDEREKYNAMNQEIIFETNMPIGSLPKWIRNSTAVNRILPITENLKGKLVNLKYRDKLIAYGEKAKKEGYIFIININKDGGPLVGKHPEYIVYNKPKKSFLILQDVSRLQIECYDLRHVSESDEVKDVLDYVIGELHNIIHKEY